MSIDAPHGGDHRPVMHGSRASEWAALPVIRWVSSPTITGYSRAVIDTRCSGDSRRGADVASAGQPRTDGPRADPQCRGDAVRRPALLLEVPGLAASGFVPRCAVEGSGPAVDHRLAYTVACNVRVSR
jgi:hypothetical protein